MYPILLTIGDHAIPTYGVAMVLTCVACGLLVLRNFPRFLLSYVDIYNFFLLVIVAIFLGGRLVGASVATYFFSEPLYGFLPVWQGGGLASYPALLATLALFFVYCRLRGLPYLMTLDFLFPYALLALAIQRTFGCFLAGCCYGLPVGQPWGVSFPENSLAGRAFPGASIHPTQLYYSASALAIYGLLLVYSKRKIPRRTGELFFLGLGLLSVTYFFITFLRGDLGIKSGAFGWTLWQQTSLWIFGVSIAFYVVVLCVDKRCDSSAV